MSIERAGGWRGRRVGVAAALFALSAAASAAPYAIRYTGTIASSTIPGIQDGQPYTVTLVFNNGNATTASQTWGLSDLKCIRWTMNSAANFTFTQDLASSLGSLDASGSISTDGAGTLTSVFTELVLNSPVSATTWSATGFTPVPLVYWYLNDVNGVFYDTNGARLFDDAAGGVQMDVLAWTDPASDAGSCVAKAAAAVVPTLSEWARLGLSGLLAFAAWVAYRCRTRARG